VQRELVQAVLGLPEPYRTTILLRFFDGLPPRAIAKRMGVPVDTVRTRVTRGVAQLRARLDDGRGGDRTAWLAALAPLLRTPSPLVPPPLSTLGAALVNAKIQIAVAALVVGGALTLYLATRAPEPEKSAIAAAAPAAEPSATVEPRAPSSAALAAEAPAGTAAATRGPAPMATTQAAIPEVQAGPAMLRGRVLDDGGAPLSGVRIAAAADGGKLTGDAATSAQDGAFEMSYPQRAERLVSADERFATVFAGLCGGTPSAGEIVVVVAPRVEVAGRVVGEEGYPLPGARVELEVPEEVRTRFRAVLDRSMRLSWQVAADAHGEFAVPAAPRVAGAILHAASDGYVPFSGALEEHSGPGLVITLARPRSEDGLLRGKVLDAGGSPVSTAHVALGVDTTRTEGDGTFSFRLADPDSFAARFRVPPREIVACRKGSCPRATSRRSWTASRRGPLSSCCASARRRSRSRGASSTRTATRSPARACGSRTRRCSARAAGGRSTSRTCSRARRKRSGAGSRPTAAGGSGSMACCRATTACARWTATRS
jgi:protocatechuate 3,4-dioxygenase beta subunit